MNFIGHIQVAISVVDATDGVLIGAALPDIAAMGRFRLSSPAADDAVRAGVALHHRTDDLFHAHPWFRQHSQAVSTTLQGFALSRGAARACGHVGVEMLLDGLLLETDAELGSRAGRAMAKLDQPALGLNSMVEPDRQPDWGIHLGRTAGWGLPDDYRDPAAVAERLQRILTRRPRLSFAPEAVRTVADVLAEQQQSVEAGAADLLTDLAAALCEH